MVPFVIINVKFHSLSVFNSIVTCKSLSDTFMRYPILD